MFMKGKYKKKIHDERRGKKEKEKMRKEEKRKLGDIL